MDSWNQALVAELVVLDVDDFDRVGEDQQIVRQVYSSE